MNQFELKAQFAEEFFEDHIAKQIKERFIAKDGQPLKCECGCTEFKQVNQTYGEG